MKKAYAFLFIAVLSLCVFIPLIRADNTNLAPIPNALFWTSANAGGQSYGWSIGDWTGADVYPVTWQGQTTIELPRNNAYMTYTTNGNDNNGAFINELDGYQNVKVGDVVYFGVWIWTSSSTVGDNGNLRTGAHIEVDMYGSGNGYSGRICCLTLPNNILEGVPVPSYSSSYPNDHYAWSQYSIWQSLVPWGSGTWIHTSISFTVASSYQSDGFNSGIGDAPAGVAMVPNEACPLIGIQGAVGSGEAGVTYIYGTELYVNPSGTPTATPTPHPTPTPTPTPTPPWTPTPVPTPIHSINVPYPYPLTTQTVTVNMDDSTVIGDTYAHLFSVPYHNFTATFDFSNTTLQGYEYFALTDNTNGYGENYGWGLVYVDSNLVLIDSYLDYSLVTFSGVPPTVTFSYNGTTLTCNGQSFTYDGVNNFSERNINASNPINYFSANSDGHLDNGTVTLTIQSYNGPTSTSTPSSGETVLSSNPDTYSYYTLDYHPFGSDLSGYYETFYLPTASLINQVDLCLDTDGATTQPFTVSLQSLTNGVPNRILEYSNSTLSGAGLVASPSWQWYNFTFAGTTIYQPGNYAFTISSAGWGSQYNLIRIRNGNIQEGSVGIYFGGQWTTMGPAAYDISYYIYGSAYVVPTPTPTSPSSTSAPSTFDLSGAYMTWILYIIIIVGFLVLAAIVAKAKTQSDRGRK